MPMVVSTSSRAASAAGASSVRPIPAPHLQKNFSLQLFLGQCRPRPSLSLAAALPPVRDRRSQPALFSMFISKHSYIAPGYERRQARCEGPGNRVGALLAPLKRRGRPQGQRKFSNGRKAHRAQEKLHCPLFPVTGSVRLGRNKSSLARMIAQSKLAAR